MAEIEYKISLLLNHQAAHFDWPPAVNTLTLMNCFHLNNRALKFSEIKIFFTAFFLSSPILSTSFHFLLSIYFFCSVPVLWFSFSFSSYDLYLLFYFLLFSHFIRLPRKCKFSLLDFMTSRVSKIDIQNINVIMRHFPGP